MLAYTFSGDKFPANCNVCSCHWCPFPLKRNSRGGLTDSIKKKYKDKRHEECPLQIIEEPAYCTVCGGRCYENQSPEVVFRTEEDVICENCSIDYEEVDGKVVKRKDV